MSPRLEKAMKDLLPWKGWGMSWKKVGRSNILRQRGVEAEEVWGRRRQRKTERTLNLRLRIWGI